MSSTTVGTLTDQQIAVLEFERVQFATPGHAPPVGVVATGERWLFGTGKPAAIRQALGISEMRYGQILSALLDLPAAEVYDAQLVRRLRRIRDARRGGRRRS